MATTQMTGERIRVRTPGKYIVFSSAAMVLVAAAGIAFVKRATPLERINAPEMVVTEHGADRYLELQDFLVDLKPDQTGRVSYLKLSTSLIISANDEAALAHIAELRPLIRERITFFLRQLQPKDLEEPAQMERVKVELTRRVNLVLDAPLVSDVAIRDLVVQ